MILSAIAERLKRQSKDDFKGRHFEASLILQADRCRGSAAFNFPHGTMDDPGVRSHAIATQGL